MRAEKNPKLPNYQLIKNVVIGAPVECTGILRRTVHVIVYVIYAFITRLCDRRRNITSMRMRWKTTLLASGPTTEEWCS
jgi:hypothetical protein